MYKKAKNIAEIETKFCSYKCYLSVPERPKLSIGVLTSHSLKTCVFLVVPSLALSSIILQAFLSFYNLAGFRFFLEK